MGLPGSGKTTLAKRIIAKMESSNRTVTWLNADEVRKEYDDWDFSIEGRIRQSLRMNELAKKAETEFVVCDFVCPLPEMRKNFDPHFIIWLDTVTSSQYKDTDNMFIRPEGYTFKLLAKDAEKWGDYIAINIMNTP